MPLALAGAYPNVMNLFEELGIEDRLQWKVRGAVSTEQTLRRSACCRDLLCRTVLRRPGLYSPTASETPAGRPLCGHGRRRVRDNLPK